MKALTNEMVSLIRNRVKAANGFSNRGRPSKHQVMLNDQIEKLIKSELPDAANETDVANYLNALPDDLFTTVMESNANKKELSGNQVDATEITSHVKSETRSAMVDMANDNYEDSEFSGPADLFTSSLSPITKREVSKLYKGALPKSEEIYHYVNNYYRMQNMRMIFDSQIREIEKKHNGEPTDILKFFSNEFSGIEGQHRTILDVFTDNDPVAWTIKQIIGVGPVIAAGLVSYLSVEKAQTASQFIRYCGVDPGASEKRKGSKINYNPKLKVLVAFKLGESFIKTQNRDTDFYGHIYAKWKQIYLERNDSGFYADYAKNRLMTKKFDKNTSSYEAYSKGILPDAQIHNRARRKAVSIFIAHLFQLMYETHYHCLAPVPYIFEYGEPLPDGTRLQHAEYIKNPMIPIYEAKYGEIPLDKVAPHTLLKDSRNLLGYKD